MSPVSKFLKILRIEHNETAKDMSDRLDISPSYLSAIENGKRNIPLNFQDSVISTYSLSEEKATEFKKAVEQSFMSVKIKFSAYSSYEKAVKLRQIILALSKADVDDEVVDKIYRIINRD